MAAWYVYSGAAGTASGADWTNAKTTLAAAITASSAGDTFYVAHDHAESQASALTLSFKGSNAAPDTILCVNRAGSVPPVAADLAATATITTTGASNISITGRYYMRGVTFNAGSGAVTANINVVTAGGVINRHELCAFNLVSTGGISRINWGGVNNCTIFLDTCTVSFGSTSQGINADGSTLVWRNASGTAAIIGATIPTTLFLATGNYPTPVTLVGLDLSAMGSGKTIVASGNTRVTAVNCKLGASVTVGTTPSGRDAQGLDLIGCSNSSNVRRDERYRYEGTLTTETTIKRTAGASDGTTAFSHKIVTTANAKRTFPFESFEGVLWNDTTGSSKTLTVHTVSDNVTLTDAEIWLEVEYLGNASYPVTSLVTDANATVLTTAANQTSDSGEAWTTTGLTTPVKQKLDVSFTPQMKGPIRWKVKVAKASTTVYICPKADLS